MSNSYTFTAPGVYSVRLTVTDDDGSAGTATTIGELEALVVVYDPSAGFVTGGGWIDSPAGAYLADAALTGKANFGFVSKYHHGTTVPDGQTEFQFKAGNLNFHSTAYDWLVVSGARAKFKGSGTINGADSFGFMLTAIDGQLPGGGGKDKFRIKIFDKINGGIVYDNQIGATDGADPTTELGGGSIVIHSDNLLATDMGPLSLSGDEWLQDSELGPLMAAARAGWLATGGNAWDLGNIDVRVADLEGNAIGLTACGTVWVDGNAAGWGWFVDPTPGDDCEFTTPGDQGEQNRMDLLTVLLHEMGHVLGHDHDEGGVMSETLTAGARRSPDPLPGADHNGPVLSVMRRPPGESAVAVTAGQVTGPAARDRNVRPLTVVWSDWGCTPDRTARATDIHDEQTGPHLSGDACRQVPCLEATGVRYDAADKRSGLIGADWFLAHFDPTNLDSITIDEFGQLQ